MQAQILKLDRLSVELTNRCAKACWFCYNASQPGGATSWTVEENAGHEEEPRPQQAPQEQGDSGGK